MVVSFSSDVSIVDCARLRVPRESAFQRNQGSELVCTLLEIEVTDIIILEHYPFIIWSFGRRGGSQSAAMEPHQERESLLPYKHRNSSNLNHDAVQVSVPHEEDTGLTFNAGRRPYRDSIFTFLFLGTILITYGCGIFSFTRADFTLDSKLGLSKFNPDTNQCEMMEKGSLEEDQHVELMLFSKLIIFVPICAFVLTFPASILLFTLLRRCTRAVVLVTNPLMSLVPLVTCVFWFTWCYGVNEYCASEVPVSSQILYAIFFPALAAYSVYQTWRNFSKKSFEVTVKLLKMATDAFKQHLLLLILQPILFPGFMVLVSGPIVTFIWYAFYNGKIVPNFDVVLDPSKGCDLATGYPCCVNRRPEWFTAYIALACFTLFWVLMVTSQLQILIVSSTISQWYFTPTGTSTTGSLKRSLRIAFGPSFGTACNLGTIVMALVVALLRLLKRVTTKVATSSNRQGSSSGVVECHTRFALNFAIISGDSFWESSKKASSLLRRNSLSTTGTVFALPTRRVLVGMTSLYAILQSSAVYGGLVYFSQSTYHLMNFIIAEFCFTATILGLLYYTQALSAVIDTVYLCYAMEKDTGEISKPETCHAFMLLPQNEEVLAGRLAPKEQLSAP